MACVSGRGGEGWVTVIHAGHGGMSRVRPPPRKSLQDDSLIHRDGAPECLRESEGKKKVPALPVQGPGVGRPQSRGLTLPGEDEVTPTTISWHVL